MQHNGLPAPAGPPSIKGKWLKEGETEMEYRKAAANEGDRTTGTTARPRRRCTTLKENPTAAAMRRINPTEKCRGWKVTQAPKRGRQAFCNGCENSFEPGELRIAADWQNAKAPYRHIRCLDVPLPPPTQVQGLDALPPEKRSEAIQEILMSRRRRGIKGNWSPACGNQKWCCPLIRTRSSPQNV